MPPHLPSKLAKLYHSSSNLLLLLLLLSLLLLLLFSLRHHHSSQIPSPHSRNAPPPPFPETLFLSLFQTSNSTIASHLKSLTRGPHLAGTPASSSAASYVLSHFDLSGLETLTKNYTPLLSFPAFSSLALLHPNLTLIKPLPLSEPADPAAKFVPPYHAYSPSGSALAPAVYVNYGRDEDYSVLDGLGVSVRDCVVIVRRGEGPRGALVEAAAERGARVVLMFGEKIDGGVERGTVLLGGPGDPLTPGWAADGGERLRVEVEDAKRRFPKIPSMPVSLGTAKEILKRMGGPRVPEEWTGRVVGEWSGVGGGPLLVNFTYQEDRRPAAIQNVFGIIRGREEPDRYVILGNHRDAWTYGAVDPNSGTAALLDIAHRYGVMFRSGWRPRRTIVLCSWDAEEFGMIGSTEWVEQNLGILGPKAVAYLNVDCAVQGSGFFAGATPQLDKLLVEITNQIKDPDFEGMTVYQTWVATNGGISIERLARADSDFSAFLHHAGVPSVDLYYGKEFPGYHTAFDSFDWMEKHGDPLFHRHVAISEIWGLLGLRLADDPGLPFDYLSYATQLQNHTDELRALLDSGESLLPIIISLDEFTAAANESLKEAKKLKEQEAVEDFSVMRQRTFNDRLMLAERGFLEAEGLRGRQWFKHLLYAPPEDYQSKLYFFPGIADAISRGRKVGRREAQAQVQHEIWRVARAIQRAAGALRGELT